MEFCKIPVVFTACDMLRYKVNRKKGWHVEFNTNCQLVITYYIARWYFPYDNNDIKDTINFPSTIKLNTICITYNLYMFSIITIKGLDYLYVSFLFFLLLLLPGPALDGW